MAQAADGAKPSARGRVLSDPPTRQIPWSGLFQAIGLHLQPEPRNRLREQRHRAGPHLSRAMGLQALLREIRKRKEPRARSTPSRPRPRSSEWPRCWKGPDHTSRGRMRAIRRPTAATSWNLATGHRDAKVKLSWTRGGFRATLRELRFRRPHENESNRFQLPETSESVTTPTVRSWVLTILHARWA